MTENYFSVLHHNCVYVTEATTSYFINLPRGIETLRDIALHVIQDTFTVFSVTLIFFSLI